MIADSMNEWMNDKGDYKTAPATLGRLTVALGLHLHGQMKLDVYKHFYMNLPMGWLNNCKGIGHKYK